MLTRIYGTAFFSKKELAAAPRAARAGARARPPQARPRARTCSRSPRSRRARRSGCRKGTALCERARRAVARDERRRAASPRSRRRSSTTASCGRPRATGASTARTCSSPRPRAHEFGLKPMNCPGALRTSSSASAGVLPRPAGALRRAGLLHRNELERRRCTGCCACAHFTQDDAHIFCTEDQIEDEVRRCLEFAFATLRDLRLRESQLELSTRPEKRIGTDEMWDRAEARARGRARRPTGLRVRASTPATARSTGRRSTCTSTDSLGRSWQLGTVPARLLDARALRPRLHRRRQRRAPPGDDPPRAAGLVRALHRDPDRALRRRVPGLARAGAGDRAADLRPPRRGRARASPPSCARAGCASRSTSARSRSAARSATPSCEDPVHAGRRRPRGGGGRRSPCAATARATSATMAVDALRRARRGTSAAVRRDAALDRPEYRGYTSALLTSDVRPPARLTRSRNS